MLRDDAVNRIKRRLLNRTGSGLDTSIVESLQDAQERLEQEEMLPWFLISEVSSILTTSNEERIPLPSDFLREIDEDSLWYYDASATNEDDQWTALAKDDTEALRKAYPGSGSPKGYSLIGDYFRIFPTPDAAYTLRMIYYEKATALTANIENDWLKHAAWWLIGEAGADIALSIGMSEAAQRFTEQAATSKRRVIIDTIAREESSRSRVKGGAN